MTKTSRKKPAPSARSASSSKKTSAKKTSAKKTSAKPAWRAGGCHCGAVRFRVRAATEQPLLDCNCLICVKKGHLHLLASERDFEIVSGRDALATYTFGARMAQHYFCTECGIHAFYRPRSPLDPTQWDVNARCLDNDAFRAFRIEPLDGEALEASVIATLKAELPRSSLERRYIALCEQGIYNASAQASRLGVDHTSLNATVLRIQHVLADIGERLAAKARARAT